MIEFRSSHVTYVQVDFPIPGPDFVSKDRDKMLKMQIGLQHAKALKASHVMFVDADDCVSKRLTEYVKQNPIKNGWFFSKGFDYQENIMRLRYRNRNLHLRTNTSHIIRLDLLEFEMQLSPDGVKQGGCVLFHNDTAAMLKKRGTPLNPLPFRGVIYVTNNGENIWWKQEVLASKKSDHIQQDASLLKKFYQTLITCPITDSIRDEFGLYMIKNI